MIWNGLSKRYLGGDFMGFIKNNRMKLMQLLIIIVLGTSSIWLSRLFNTLDWKATALGFITIVVSSLAPTCAEKILSLMNSSKKFEVFANYVITIVSFILCIVIIACINNENKIGALVVSVPSYICYLLVWWYQNRDNDNLVENTNAIGGNASQFNK